MIKFVLRSEQQGINACTRQESTVYLEAWILSSGSNKRYYSMLNMRQNSILLGFVKAMNFVNEHDSTLSLRFASSTVLRRSATPAVTALSLTKRA